jgi:alpha-tubulin suppressor-like RCC1 family protein
MALKVDGSLYTWGWNKFGQLGVGDFTNRDTPSLVGGGWRVPVR